MLALKRGEYYEFISCLASFNAKKIASLGALVRLTNKTHSTGTCAVPNIGYFLPHYLHVTKYDEKIIESKLY